MRAPLPGEWSRMPWYQLEDRHAGVLATRLAACAVVAAGAVLLPSAPGGADGGAVALLCGLAAALHVALWRAPQRWPRRLRLAVDLGLVVDAAWVAGLVAVAGGPRGPVAGLLLLVALWAALGYSARTGLKAGLLGSIGFLALVWDDDGRLWSTASLGRLAFFWGALAAAVLGAAAGERELRVRAERLTVLHAAARGLLDAAGAPEMVAVAREAAAALMPGWRVAVTGPAQEDGRGDLRLAREGDDGVVRVPALVAGRAAATIECRRPLPRGRRRHRVRAREIDGLETLAAGLGSALWRAALTADMERRSLTDGLTGIANRRALDAELARRLDEAARSGGTVALCLLDIDHFKSFNDTFGHQAGDEAIAAVAGVLRRTCRGGDVPARYGGEEMALVMPGADEAEAVAAAERVRASVAAAPAGPRPVTVSVGVAVAGGGTPQELLAAADAALYAAKRGGRNRVVAAGAPVTAAV